MLFLICLSSAAALPSRLSKWFLTRALVLCRDTFSTWIGDGTWADVQLDLVVTCETHGYIDMA